MKGKLLVVEIPVVSNSGIDAILMFSDNSKGILRNHWRVLAVLRVD